MNTTPYFLLDAPARIVTRFPSEPGPVLPLRTAIRRVVEQRPSAEIVEIEVEGGTLEEEEIEALYVLASLPM